MVMVRKVWLKAFICCAFAALGTAYAAVGGSISGVVMDPTGAVIPGVTLTATNTALGTQFKSTTDEKGAYVFPNLPVGVYDLTVEAEGFKPQKRTGLKIDADAAYKADMILEMGEHTDTITVSMSGVQVETVSTQMGEVISDTKMTTQALNGRSYTDLLAIQPAVVPVTSLKGDSIIMAGVTGPVAPSGELNAGNLSINGQRESANGFIVNGSDVREHMNGGTSIVPNLDSIAEFRVLTNNFDAEYGNYNGGIVNVVTKSGSDRFHGEGFEFLRNTNLDARGFYDPERASFTQNQFGGVLGGPIKRQRAFLFADYQGTRTTQGIQTGLIPVLSEQERNGDFSDAADTLTGTVNGAYWANLLSQRLGYPVRQGEPYYRSGCNDASECVFPNAAIPARAWSPPAQRLLSYIPAQNSGANLFSTSAYAKTVRDDKTGIRTDVNTGWGLVSGYYFFDDYSLSDPYPTAQGGASIPGFDAVTAGRAQLLTLSDTKTFGTTSVNEFHFSITRNRTEVGNPNGGLGVSLASQGFVTGPGTPGIVVQDPEIEGVENIVFNSFVMGVTVTGVHQANNTFHLSDNYSRVVGGHTLKIGGQFHYDQVNLDPNPTANGTFTFGGTETGSDFADFLIGIPSVYLQSAGQGYYLRNRYGGLYVQDSWRVRPALTLNYGLRWDVIMPWYEKYDQIQTVVQGQQSVVSPGAPLGLVFPGDPGIPRTLSPTRYGSFAPRVGIAYAPSFKNALLRKVFGGGNATSIRAGYGVYYTAFQGLSAGIMYGVAPYGGNYNSPAPPLFEAPFVTASDGRNDGQRFPFVPPRLQPSRKNPDTSINWPNFLPINGDPFFFHDNQVPYSEQYMLSIQRQLWSNTLLSLTYVGNQAHHLLVVQDANPGDPALCLSVSQPSQVQPGTATCGPFAESGVFVTQSGEEINGTRGPLGPNYGDVTAQKTIGNSNYNALEVNLRHSGTRSEFLVGYTYSKSIDQSSNLGEAVNPFDPALTRAISAFDLKHNFVASYRYDLPLDRVFRHRGLVTEGWSISGTTRFSSGFPVTLYNNTDTSLLGTYTNGVNNNLLDTPDFKPSPLQVNTDPRNGRDAFNTGAFRLPQLGKLGTASRRFFYGPGISNFDMALLKVIRLGENKTAQVRLEAFNVFNHAQFYGPGAVDGNISSSTFGRVVSAAAPRLVQIAMKFTF